MFSTKIVFLIFFFKLHGILSYVDVTLTSGRPLEPNDKKCINFDNLKLKRVNKTEHVVIGSLQTFVELGNDYDIEVLLFKKAGNEYKKTPYHVGPEKFCNYIQYKAINYDEVRSVSDLPERKDCPWPISQYNFTRGYVLPLDKVPPFFEGDYMVQIGVNYNRKIQSAYQASFTVIRF